MWQCYIDSQEFSGFLGEDQGAGLPGALRAAGERGAARNDLCPMPDSYTTKIPAAARHDAAKHLHLGSVAYDARQWDVMVDWITNKDAVLFGGRWTSAMDAMNSRDYIVQPRHLKSGIFRGYHCEHLCGWEYVDGILCPVVRGTHGTGEGRDGYKIISRDAWEEVYLRDPNTVVLAFGDIKEREPKRRSFRETLVGDVC